MGGRVEKRGGVFGSEWGLVQLHGGCGAEEGAVLAWIHFRAACLPGVDRAVGGGANMEGMWNRWTAGRPTVWSEAALKQRSKGEFVCHKHGCKPCAR
jgi:hypothetical protein